MTPFRHRGEPRLHPLLFAVLSGLPFLVLVLALIVGTAVLR